MSDEPVIYEDTYTWPLDGTGPNFAPAPEPPEDFVYPVVEPHGVEPDVVPDSTNEGAEQGEQHD